MNQFYFVEKGVRSQVVNHTSSAEELRQAMLRCNTEQLIASHRSFDPDCEVKKRMLCLIVGEHIEGQPLTRLDANFRHGSHILLDFDGACDPAAMATLFVQRLADAGLGEVVNHCYIEESVSGKIHLLAPRLSDDVGEDIFAYSEFFFGDGGDDPMFDRTCKNTSRLCILTGHALVGTCLENLQRDIPAGLLSALRAAVYGDGEDATLVTPVSEAPTHPKGIQPTYSPSVYRGSTAKPGGSSEPSANSGPTAENTLTLPENLTLTVVVEGVVKALCGKDTPSKGERNETLYRASVECSYIQGVTPEALIAAFAELGNYGLPKSEIPGCVRSALKREQFWQHRPSPLLSEVVANLQATMDDAEVTAEEAIGEVTAIGEEAIEEKDTVDTDTVATDGMELPFNPFSETPVAMPPMKDWPAFPRFLVKNVPLCCAAHCLNQLEPALATYLTGCTATSINGELINLYAGNLAFTIAPMSSGKSSRNEILRRVLARMKNEDEASRKAVEEWNALARRTKTEDLPEKPVFNSHIMGSDATSAALLMRLKQLSEGALFIGVDEMSMLSALQSSSSDSKGPLLLAFSQEDWTVERSTELGESGSVSMMLNVSAMGTPYQAKKFFENGYHSGLLSRSSINTLLSDDLADDEFFYKPYDDAYQETLEQYIDKLVAAQHKHLSSKTVDRHIRKLREDALTVAAATGSESLRVLVRRQLIIATRRAFLYLILNDMKFTKKLESFLTGRFQYGLWAMYYTLGDLIAKEEAEERGVALKRAAGPCNWLSELGETFTSQQLTDLRKQKKAPTDRRSVQKLLNTWKARGYIEPDPTTPGTWRNLRKRS